VSHVLRRPYSDRSQLCGTKTKKQPIGCAKATLVGSVFDL